MRADDIIRLLPKRTISAIMQIEGPLLRRVANHSLGLSLIRNVTHGGLGRLAIGVARKTRLLEGLNPIKLSMWLLRHYFEPYLEEESVTDDEAVFYLKTCPYGWRDGEDAKLCDAVMQLERELAKGLGATLVIEETIPEGAPRCRFSLRV